MHIHIVSVRFVRELYLLLWTERQTLFGSMIYKVFICGLVLVATKGKMGRRGLTSCLSMYPATGGPVYDGLDTGFVCVCCLASVYVVLLVCACVL